MKVYLDTSAFVKRYCEEDGSNVISDIFESDNEIVTSHWTLAEAIAAIDRKVAKKQITVEERDLSLSILFSDILDKNIALVRLSDEFLYPIIEKILTHHISADDALQLFSCIVSLSPLFLACDKSLLEAAAKEGLESINVEKAEDRQRLKEII